jgi:hypothetical protein
MIKVANTQSEAVKMGRRHAYEPSFFDGFANYHKTAEVRNELSAIREFENRNRKSKICF